MGAGGPSPSDIRVFPARAESVRKARVFVAAALAHSPAAANAALMTSELVTNAIQHSASGLPGGTVIVSVRRGHAWVRVDVHDQGELVPGISARIAEGMGLTIVREFADVSGSDGPDSWFVVFLGGAR
jgi:anti-sigma regulatory factor (Ser/Thr protein kinase)